MASSGSGDPCLAEFAEPAPEISGDEAEEAAGATADPNQWCEDSSSSEYDVFFESLAATAAANRERGGLHLPGATGKRKRKKRSGNDRLKRAIATHGGIQEMAKAKGYHLVEKAGSDHRKQLRDEAG